MSTATKGQPLSCAIASAPQIPAATGRTSPVPNMASITNGAPDRCGQSSADSGRTGPVQSARACRASGVVLSPLENTETARPEAARSRAMT